MLVPQHDDLYSFKSLILPPLYLSDSGVIDHSNKEMLLKEPLPLFCQKGPAADSDATVCSLSDSCASIGNTNTNTSSRRVAFKRDKYGRTIVTEHPSSLEELTPEDCEATWYKKSEYKYWKKYGKKLASVASDSKYGKDFEKTCKACSKAEDHTTDLVDRYSKIANSAARGLEILVAPHLVKSRKGTIKSVLKTQEKLPADMSYGERAELLRATSCILSQPTKAMARILGKGDANVARQCHREATLMCEDC